MSQNFAWTWTTYGIRSDEVGRVDGKRLRHLACDPLPQFGLRVAEDVDRVAVTASPLPVWKIPVSISRPKCSVPVSRTRST